LANKKRQDIKPLTINDISKIRKIASLIIDILEDNIINLKESNNIALDEKNKELLTFLIGDKNNIVSTINKLSNLLVKIIPLENNLDKDQETNNKNLNSNDLEIIKRYIKKCGIMLSPQNNEKS